MDTKVNIMGQNCNEAMAPRASQRDICPGLPFRPVHSTQQGEPNLTQALDYRAQRHQETFTKNVLRANNKGGTGSSKWAMRVSPPSARMMQDTTSAVGFARTFCSTWRCQPPSPSQGHRLLVYHGASSHYSGGSVVQGWTGSIWPHKANAS